MTQLKNSLASSEWTVVLSLLVILASLVALAKINAHQAAVLVEVRNLKPAEAISVTFEGAVAKPGTYFVKPGTLLSLAVKKARPKACADLKKLDLSRRIDSPLQIQIEEVNEITVVVDGAVAFRQELVLPRKTRICDLKSKVHFTEEAHPELVKALFNRRRALKDGEILWVPKKTVE